MKYLTLQKCGVAAATIALFSATPAFAELPEPVRAMIDAAIATGEADKVSTVLELAKVTNPDDAAEIDAIGASFDAEQQKLADQEAAAQEENIRSAGLFDNWSGEGQIGAFRSTGNSSNTGVTAGLNLERKGIDWRHKLTALADFQRTNGVTTREQFLFAYEPNYQLNDRLFVYALGQYERDRFQGFSSRISASGGIGYRVIDNDSTQLSVKAGPAYRKTSFINGGSTSNIAGLAALDFDWQVADTVKLTQDASAFIQSGNSTYISTTGLEAGLGGNLSARIAYAVEHDTNPPLGALKTDTLTRFTLIYGF
jgi:putative salt-induced outer membrane protein